MPTECNGVGNMVNVPSEDVIALGLEDQYPPLNGEVYFESYESMWELGKALQVEEDGKVTKWGLSSQILGESEEEREKRGTATAVSHSSLLSTHFSPFNGLVGP